MLMNRDLYTKAFHDRCYAYSSGTKFSDVVQPLRDWMARVDKAREVYDETADEGDGPTTDPPPKAGATYKKLVDHDGLFCLIGDALITFIRLKPQPYGQLTLKSKQHFALMPIRKPNMTFVFMSRYLLGFSAQRQWKRFKEEDYKFNTRMFRRFDTKREEILAASELYNALPDTYDTPQVTRQRARPSDCETLSSDSPMKRRFIVRDDSTDEEA